MTNDEKVRRFERALAQGGGTHSLADVLDRIGQGKAQCWTNGDSVVITEVLMFPQKRVCNYWLVSGDLYECAELQPSIDEWARSEGCTAATAIGRMGWLRLSRTPMGEPWQAVGVKFSKPLRSIE